MKLDIDNTISWVIDAIGAAGFSMLAFWVAWHWADWDRGQAANSDSWDRYIGPVLFAVGGFFAAVFMLRLLWKAFNRSRNKADDAVMHG